MADALLGKLRALESRYNATVDDYDGNQTALNYAHKCAAFDLADLLPQIIAEIERQSAGNARYEYLRSMTLRDYFAAKAEVFPGDLQPALILALLGEPCWDSSYLGRIKWVAHGEAAYRYMKADAMIAERTASEEPK